MDDGSRVNKGMHLNTNFFSTSEVERLVKVLDTKFGLKCTVQSRNRIYIWVESVPAFIALVKPYIHTSMMKKIEP